MDTPKEETNRIDRTAAEVDRKPSLPVERPEEPERVPTAGEVLAEAAELGALLVEAWWQTAGRVTELAVVEPVRAIAHLASLARPRPIASVAPRIGAGGSAAEHSDGRLRGSLRERGAELLRRSADVSYEQESHPAYLRILDQMAPDEARILRLLANEGPQPIVDVRDGLPGMGHNVASSLSMVGASAGCRYPERLSAYLDNLTRLGLVAVSPEPVPEPERYQLLEAQPDVVEARRAAGKLGRTARHSLALTLFGSDFCARCLPLD